MASIRITKKIKERIINNVHFLFKPAFTKIETAMPASYWDDCVEYILNNKPYLYIVRNNLPDTYPEEWFLQFKSVDIYLDSHVEEYAKTLIKQYNILNLSKIVSGSQFKLNLNEVSPELKSIYINYKENKSKLNTERYEFSEKLKRVLNNCTTITQFKKVWPQAEHLLTGVEEIVNTSTTRKKKKIEVDEETINGLNSTLLKRTLLNN